MTELQVTLAATIHDPEGRSAAAVRELAGPLRDLFGGFALNATCVTAPAVIQAAQQALNASIITHPPAESTIGIARRDSVSLALKQAPRTVFYSDFDHVLRWVRKDASEVRAVLEQQPLLDMLVVGRSDSAFQAEPRRLQDTERVVNHIYRLMTGRAWDLLFAVRRLSRAAAERVVELSRVETIANDVEWPLLAERLGLTLGYAEADGLYYRTMEDFDATTDAHDNEALQWIRRIEFAAENAKVLRAYLGDSR